MRNLVIGGTSGKGYAGTLAKGRKRATFQIVYRSDFRYLLAGYWFTGREIAVVSSKESIEAGILESFAVAAFRGISIRFQPISASVPLISR